MHVLHNCRQRTVRALGDVIWRKLLYRGVQPVVTRQRRTANHELQILAVWPPEDKGIGQLGPWRCKA